MNDIKQHSFVPAFVPTLRRATSRDLPAIVRLWITEGARKDAEHDDPHAPCYGEALAAIENDPNNALIVAELDGQVAGAFQLTVIQNVANCGSRTAQVESVVVDAALRSKGVGAAMMRWAIDEARRRGCLRIQLTSNKRRLRAHAFYERLGFVASHEGMKLEL